MRVSVSLKAGTILLVEPIFGALAALTIHRVAPSQSTSTTSFNSMLWY